MKELYILFSLFLLGLSVRDGHAVSAYPNSIPIEIDGQTVYIKLIGDEHNKRAETEDGYTIIQNENNKWYYATLASDGYLHPSSFVLKSARQQSDVALTNFLATTPRHLKAQQQAIPTDNQDIPENRVGKALGSRRILIILMEFQDVKFSKTATDFDNLFNKEKYKEDGAQGSVKDFYLSASYGQLELSCDIYGVYTARHNMAFYGGNAVNGQDSNPYELFTEAINNVAQEVDLKLYDGDGDGFLDNVHIIYSGYGEEAGASGSAIWAHEALFRVPYEIAGVKIDRYSCAPELRGNKGNGISRIGVHCHEIGHALGAMDYYDTDYATGGEYPGTGKWDLMASGSWNNDGITPADFNPYVKSIDYGWISPKKLPTGNVVLHPSSNDVDSYYVLGSSDTADYYIFENRSQDKWGAGLPGAGLLVYHVHPNIARAGNKINVTAPQMCYIVCASSTSKHPTNQPASYGSVNSAGCPFPGSSNNHSFGHSSIPQPFYWNGGDCGIEIDNITLLNNGDIQLVNRSEGTNYEPVELKQLFFEGFEGEKLYSLISTVSGEWKVIEDNNNGISLVNRPLAHSGSKSLQLTSRSLISGNASSSIEFSCQLADTMSYIQLSGFYTSYKLTKKKANTLKIGYRESDTNDWFFSEFKSSTNLTWNAFTINIPSGFKELQFRIEGEALAGTILALDDIQVAQQVTTSGIGHLLYGKNSMVPSIFTLNGQKSQNLQRGINIVKKTDGTTVKIMSR